MYTVSQKNWTLFHLRITLEKSCQILIILSLLQTEINYDQVAYILKSTTSALPCKMNNNVLANVAGMIS